MIRSNSGSRFIKTAQRSAVAALTILLLAGAVSLAQRNPIGPKRWPATHGDMLSARSNACSVLLPDGRVLISGGLAGDVRLSSSEYFANGRFFHAPEMAEARSDHSCAVLRDGTVFVAGGRAGGGTTNSTEILDLTTGVWNPGPQLPSSRAGSALATLKDGRLLLAGGETAGVVDNGLLVFDPGSRTFRVLEARLSSPRRDHAVAALKDGRILIAGGFDGEKYLDSIDLFDPVSGTISSAGKLSVPRSRLSATTLLDGRVVFLGGGDDKTEYGGAEVYNPKTGAISLDESMMAQPRRGHSAIRVGGNNTVLLIGGTAGGQFIAQNEAYVPWKHRFQAAGALDAGRTAATVMSLGQAGQALVAGGAGPAGPLATAHVACVPTVSTDKADYAPGTTVVITGSCWTPGGTVQMTLTEQPDLFGESPIAVTPSVVAADGTFTNTTFAPDNNDVGVTFYLTATESVDGNGNAISPALTAQTSFTDNKTITLALSGTGSGTVASNGGSGTLNCTWNGTAESGTCRDNGFGNNETVTLTATPGPGSTVGNWTLPPGSAIGSGCNSGNTTCTFTLDKASQTIAVTFNNTPTTLNVGTASGAYGTTTSLSATLKANNSGVNGKTITFTLNGTTVGNATTNPGGVATLNAVSLKINVGTYATGVGASFGGDSAFAAANATNTLTVSTKAITVTAATNTKTYDGTTTAAATPTVTSGGPLVAGDTGNFTETYANKNAGTAKTLTPTGSVADGNGGANYSITFVNNTTGVIAARSLKVTATGVNKVYDGATTATVTLADDRIAGDVFTDSFTSAAFASKNVGAGKVVSVSGISISGADAGNYTTNTTTSTSADITARVLTVKAAGLDKVYDGNTTATVTLADDRVSGDVFSDSYSTATFGNKNVGANKAVSVSGISISGADAANYSFNTTATTTASITARALHVTATGQNKVYDGNTSATVTYADDRVPGDTLSVSGSAAFGDKNVGAAKPVSVTGISVTGTDSGNYTFNTTASATADITARPLTVSAAGVDKVYDGTTSATVTLSDNKLGGDTVTEAYTSASFADKNVGIGKTVNVTGISISGADAGNYALSNTNATATAKITARPLTVTATGVDKVYDGTATATVTLADNRISGDVFTDTYSSASFTAGKSVGAGKAISVSGISISGADAANYTFNTSATTTANITARPLHVTATGVNKTYDGTPAASVVFGDDRVAGDLLTVSDTAMFFDKNVGINKAVAVSGIFIAGGNDAGNYALANTTASTTASIAPRPLTVTATGVNKVYDGDTTATVTLVDDKVAGDSLTESYTTATFADKAAATGKAITVSGISISGGTDAGNYTLVNTTASATADITKRTLKITVSGGNKVYDGALAAQVNLSDNRVSGDLFTVTYGTALFMTKNVGTGKPVQVTGLAISGVDAGNYTVSTTASTDADITPRPLHVSASAASKVYDGTTAATVTFSDDRVGGDSLIVSDSATFADKNAGAGKLVSVTGISIGGTDAGNYSLANTTASATASITPRTLTVTATGVNKVYDGTISATVTLADDRVAGDSLTDSYSAASFADKNVGTAKIVSVSGISVTGADAGNYTFNSSASTKGDITARALTVSATAQNKVYDGNANATVTLADNRISGDVFTDSFTAAVFSDKNVGTAKTVGVSGISLSGADATNYTFNPTATTTASITARTLHFTATAQDKVYDGNTTAIVTFSDDRAPGDSLSVKSGATFADKNVGTGKPVSITGISVTGTDAGNYTFNTTASGSASITPRPLTVSATGVNRVYDGGTSAFVTLSDDRVSGDNIADAYTSASFADKNVGTAKSITVIGISISSGDSGNYSLSNTTATATANITPRSLSVTAAGVNKTYDGTTAATVILTDNRITGDGFADSYSSAAFADRNAGSGKTVTVSGVSISGPDAGNYTFNSTTTATANITPRPITVTATANSKVYDGTTSAQATPSVPGLVGGDTSGFTESYDTKNAGSGKLLTPSGAVKDGNNGNNYAVTPVSSALGTITAAPLTITAVSCTKPYDGTASAPCMPVASGLQTGDTVTNLTEIYDTKFAGTGKTLAVAAYTINDGNAGKNYAVALVPNSTGVITNDPPIVTLTAPVSGLVSPAGTAISFSGSFTDAPGDTHSATWTFQDSSGSVPITISGVVTDAPTGGGTVTGSYPFTSRPGVYSVTLTVTDANNATGSANKVAGLPAFLVVYDPSAGFVTGGGWIQSKPGAYVPNPSLSGQATFGFVSKYQKGQTVPTGQTQFTFTVGNLDFHSTNYQWLVVSGPMAQYKGNGVINGAGNYTFLLTARDGSKAGDDGFRIKITDSAGTVVYDNLMSTDDSNTTANVQTLGGGSVQIHN